MTRRKEIEHKAGSISDGMIAHNVSHSECKGYYEGYIDGAKWADKTMIDKACEWMMRYGCEYATEEVMVEHFRKAMEE